MELLKIAALSDSEEKFVARKLSGLLSSTYQQRLVLKSDNIDVHIVETLYSFILDYCHSVGLLKQTVKLSEVIVFYDDKASAHIN